MSEAAITITAEHWPHWTPDTTQSPVSEGQEVSPPELTCKLQLVPPPNSKSVHEVLMAGAPVMGLGSHLQGSQNIWQLFTSDLKSGFSSHQETGRSFRFWATSMAKRCCDNRKGVQGVPERKKTEVRKRVGRGLNLRGGTAPGSG